MSIYKKINDEDIKVAENSIIDHSQLSGREAYGAHPISAIRNLPEKLSTLKQVTGDIQTNASRINLESNDDGTFTFTNYQGEQQVIQGGYLPDGSTIDLETLQGQEKLVAKGLQTTNDGMLSGDAIKEEFVNLKSVVNAKGGYLDSYNFQTATPTQEELTEYALQDIGISQASQIWDRTRVINMFNDETWSWDLGSLSWSNLGNISIISDANNSGLHGLVTGSDADYMGRITADGEISINALPELASQVGTNTGDIAAETLARQQADTDIQNTVNGLIVNQYNNAQNKTYSADYVNENFAPLSFVARLYFSRTGATTASLVNSAPAADNANVLTTTTTNTDYDWSSTNLTITRTLAHETTLVATNSLAVHLNFSVDRDETIAFGARLKVSTDAGAHWTYISTNQSYAAQAYETSTTSTPQVCEANLLVYFDALAAEVTYPKDALIAVEIYKKQETSTALTTTYYCGVTIDNANVYCTAQINFGNVTINTDQLADNAVTYSKLSQPLQQSIDAIPGKQEAMLTFSNVAVAAADWVEDNTLTGYTYKAAVALTGVTSSHYPTVIFALADVVSGNYSNIVESYNGGIYIWGKANSAITLDYVIAQ